MQFKYDLFLSHNNADKLWAEFLVTAIESDKSGLPLKVFFDKRDIGPGKIIPLEIEDALQKSRHIGLILSPESLESKWVSLERSTVIYQNCKDGNFNLIPLLRKTCHIPVMLSPLKFIDFRRDQDFHESLTELMNVLRGRPARPTETDLSRFSLRQDAILLSAHRKIFDRPAFRQPCINELFISELSSAIDGTSAAISTGSLYSRNHNLLATFGDYTEYQNKNFREPFDYILSILLELKRAIVEFEEFFKEIYPEYSHHKNFLAMVGSYLGKANDKKRTAILINMMDKIDILRNKILTQVNTLLSLVESQNKPFLYIELSSILLMRNEIYRSNLFVDCLIEFDNND